MGPVSADLPEDSQLKVRAKLFLLGQRVKLFFFDPTEKGAKLFLAQKYFLADGDLAFTSMKVNACCHRHFLPLPGYDIHGRQVDLSNVCPISIAHH